MALTDRLFGLPAGGEPRDTAPDLDAGQTRVEPRNILRLTAAQIGGSIGDALADPKVVMPWLMGAVGAPAFLTAMIVPIREALSLLPQIVVGVALRRFAVRKWFWAVALAAEGVAVLGMALLALAGLTGPLAGWAIIGCVIVFSLARGVASIASKDILGRTVAKGRRGKVGGYATAASGVVAAGAGLYLGLAPAAARPDWLLHVMLAAAASGWLLGAVLAARIVEHPGKLEDRQSVRRILARQLSILRGDPDLQRFLLARALMTGTALSAPIYVALAQQSGGGALANLGWLMLATGAAAGLSATFWGMLSDRASRTTMALGAAIGGAVGCAMLAALWLAPGGAQGILPYGAALFLLGIGHAGVRIGRKTQIVDAAGAESRSEYVAISNTIIGVVILGVGAVAGALAHWRLDAALLLLSAMALAGAALTLTLKNAQAE